MSVSIRRPRYLRLCTALATVLSLPAAAAEPSALPPASLRDFTWVSDPRFAPDGRRIAFVQTRVDSARDDYATSIWLVDGGSPPRPLTFEPGDAGSPRWSPDGRQLAFLSKRSGKSQIHVLGSGGGEAWQLTDDAQGAGAFAWSPDGRRIAFVSRAATPDEQAAAPPEPEKGESRPPIVTERLTTRADGRPGWLSARRAHLSVVATDRGPKAQAARVTGGDFDDGTPAWSRDGTTLYFSAVRKPDADWAGGDSEIYAVPAEGGREPVALTDRLGPDDNPTVSPDGRMIAYTGYDDVKRQSHTDTHLYVLDLVTRERHELARGLGRSVGDGVIADMGAPHEEGPRLVWRADSRAVYFVSADRGAVQLYEATLDGRYRALTALSAGDLRAFDVAADGRVLVTHSSPTAPSELYAFRAADAGQRTAWQALTGFNSALAARFAFVPYEELWLPGAQPSVTVFAGHPAGERQWIQGWLLKPPGFDPARRYPLVLYIHGGPHTMYGTAFFHEMQVLAHAGYLVLIANPRGSTGYGEQFANVIQYRYPGDDFEDLMAAVDFVVARGSVDPARLYVAGGSGGGLLSAWAVGHTDRFAAAVVERAVTNWHSFVGTSDLNYQFVTHWFRDAPWRDAADYLARSPLSYVERVRTPVLVIHNQEDFRAPLDQGLQFYTALRELKKPARLAVFPESSHGMSREGRPNQRIARLGLILDWFDASGR
jgi:dipeptidyl aminopeptidase/acylaminoacyl peptidase